MARASKATVVQKKTSTRKRGDEVSKKATGSTATEPQIIVNTGNQDMVSTLEDSLLNNYGFKGDTFGPVQGELLKLAEWVWKGRGKNSLRHHRLLTAPMVFTKEIDPATGKLLQEPTYKKNEEIAKKTKTVKVPSPTFKSGELLARFNTATKNKTEVSCMGYFIADKLENTSTGELIGLINICPEYFNPAFPQHHGEGELRYEVVNIVKHEMSHLLNSCNGYVDCTRDAHNGIFKTTEESTGSECYEVDEEGKPKDKKHGFGRTRLGEALKMEVDKIDWIDWSVFEVFAREAAKKPKNPPVKRDRLVCPDCTNSYPAPPEGSDIALICVGCSNNKLVEVNGVYWANMDDMVYYIREAPDSEGEA